MALHVKKESVPERKATRTGDQGEGSMVSRKGYGNECSLMIATRAPGYHTRPHVHESEQINYVLEGEIWFFVEDRGFQCKAGDFQRIPANKIHWAWNRSDNEAVVAEAHAPGLVGGKTGQGAVALFDEGESPQLNRPGENRYVPYDSVAAESKYFGIS
ncbi:MAG: cupin domain-containing protein [Candidatus Binatia bacterium]